MGKQTADMQRDPAVAAIETLNDAVATSFEVLEKDIGEVREAGKRTQLDVDAVSKRLNELRARHDTPTPAPRGSFRAWVRAEDGSRIPLVAPDERLASIYGDEEPGIVGETIRGLATGKWTEAAKKAALGSGGATGGGVLLSPAVSATIVDLARARSAVVQAGALTVPMQSGEVKIAALASGPGVSWRAENQPIVSADPTFRAVMLKARTLAVLAKVSIELVEDAANLESFIESVFASTLAAELDRVALVGSGAAEEPLGLQDTPNVNTVTSVGAPTWDDLVDAQVKVRLANGEPTAAILSPRDLGTLSKLKGTSNDHYITPPTALANVRISQTTNVPTNLGGGGAESVGFVGDFTAMWLGVRTGLTIEASRVAADSSGSAFGNVQLWIRGYLRADVAVVQPGFFTVLSGVTT